MGCGPLVVPELQWWLVADGPVGQCNYWQATCDACRIECLERDKESLINDKEILIQRLNRIRRELHWAVWAAA